MKNRSRIFALKVFVLSIFLSPFSDLYAENGEPKTTTIHGYVATDYQGGVLVNDASGKNKIIPNFEQLRFVFGFQGALGEHWSFNSEVELEHATRAGVKTTTSGGNVTSASAGLEIEVEQAWIENQHYPYLRPRFGVVLAPLGRVNVNHDPDNVASIDRPLVDQLIIPSTWYEPGIGVTGEMEWGLLALSYEAFAMNGLRGTTTTAGDETKLRDMRMSKDSANDNNTDKALVGRLGLGLGKHLDLGLSGYRGTYDPSSSLNISFAALDGVLRWKQLELEGEWVSLHLEKSQAADPTFAGLRQGWYLQALLNVAFAEASSFQPWLQVSQVDTNVSALTAQDQVRYSAGLNYRPVENVGFKLAYSDTQYFKGYTNLGGGQSAPLDQRLMASAVWGY